VPDVKPVPRWLRAANRAALALSRLGLTMGPVHVLTVPGRRTGKPRSAPVSPLTVGDGRYVVSALPESDWAAMSGPPGTPSSPAGAAASPSRSPRSPTAR
jgi:hypothetical protein